MHLAKLKVSNECLSLREQKQTLSVPPSLKKIMYFLLCTTHNETQESDALEVANKNAQRKKGRIFRVKIWLYPNHVLKESRQK
jgi:ribosomal protein L16/L10AE